MGLTNQIFDEIIITIKKKKEKRTHRKEFNFTLTQSNTQEKQKKNLHINTFPRIEITNFSTYIIDFNTYLFHFL